jgi:hypothetical protein
MKRVICLSGIIFSALSLEVFAQNSTEPASYNNAPSIASPDGAPVVALFQDQDPWGSNQNESILMARGVPFQIFPSTRMGDLDLTPFRKVVLVSQQPDDFYTRLEQFRSRFESYALGGGILEMHLANFFGGIVERVMLPFGIRITPGFCSNTVNIAAPSDPLITTPNGITSDELQNWNCSAHGSLMGVVELGLNIVVNTLEGPTGPSTAEGVPACGAGPMVVTDSPVEWVNPNTRRFNENLLCFGLAGVGSCPAPPFRWTGTK